MKLQSTGKALKVFGVEQGVVMHRVEALNKKDAARRLANRLNNRVLGGGNYKTSDFYGHVYTAAELGV